MNECRCLNASAGCMWNETAAAAVCAKDVNIISLVFIAFGTFVGTHARSRATAGRFGYDPLARASPAHPPLVVVVVAVAVGYKL